MNNPFHILIKYPSRERKDRFFEGLDSIYRNLSNKNNFHVSCTLDLDDLSMNNGVVIDKINSYSNISISWGKSESKIHAVNRNMPDYDFDILICMSDDMRFNIYGFDDIIRTDINHLFPNFDGLLHYHDNDTKGALATMYIAGRKFYDRFGYIYHPSYKSLFCDNEIEDCAKILGKWHYTGYPIYEHLNPAYGHLPRDPLFDKQQGLWNDDEANYNKRKAINFGL